MISEPPILEDLESPRPSLISSTFNLFYCRVVSRKSIRFTRMPSDARRAVWHFDALWGSVAAQLFGPTALIDGKCLLKGLDSLLKRDLVERPSGPTFPTYTRYVESKFKLSDLEVVLTNTCPKLPVTGYIQSAPTYKIYSQSTVNSFGTTIIANGPKWTLRIGMRKCMASLPSPHAVQAR
jgi:hypothetical protein